MVKITCEIFQHSIFVGRFYKDKQSILYSLYYSIPEAVGRGELYTYYNNNITFVSTSRESTLKKKKVIGFKK